MAAGRWSLYLILIAGLLCKTRVASMDELYRALDRQSLLGGLFHPRSSAQNTPAGSMDFSIPVHGALLGARWHQAKPTNRSVLFFHGNGEIVPDYDNIAGLYGKCGLNLFIVDYRGYGWSSGQPGVSTLFPDTEAVHRFFFEKTGKQKKKPLVMGRSLGSGPASYLAEKYPAAYSGLILESGFSDVIPLLQLLGIRPDGIEDQVRQLLSNDLKLQSLQVPALILHGEDDNLIPAWHAKKNHSAIPGGRKTLRILPGAGHNDLLGQANAYFAAIADFEKSL